MSFLAIQTTWHSKLRKGFDFWVHICWVQFSTWNRVSLRVDEFKAAVKFCFEDVNHALHSSFSHLTVVCDFTTSKGQKAIVITVQARTTRNCRWIQMLLRCATFKLADSRLNIFTCFFFREIRFNSRNQVVKAFITDCTVISSIVVRSAIACDQWTKTCPAAFDIINGDVGFW